MKRFLLGSLLSLLVVIPTLIWANVGPISGPLTFSNNFRLVTPGQIIDLTACGSGIVPYLTCTQTWGAPQRAKWIAPTIVGSTFTLDLSASQDFTVNLVHAACPCTVTVTNPTGATGQVGIIKVQQSATGGDTISTWNGVILSNHVNPNLSGAPNGLDYLSYAVDDASPTPLVVVGMGVPNAN